MNVLIAEISQCEAINKYLESSFADKYGNIHFVLDRKIFLKDIFKIVIQKGVNFGQKSGPDQGVILVNCSSSHDQGTVGHLRNILICNHMAQILKHNRWV